MPGGTTSFPGSASGTTISLNAGNYTVTETGPSGYTQSNSAGCSGSIANGASASCTVTNNDNAASLTVTKTVINDNGGTAVASNFTITVAGTAVPGGTTSFPGSASGTTISLNAGSYTVTETGPAGYTQSNSAGCSGTVANGASASCTVTNDDQAASLTVTKTVINDNGGTAVAGNFTITVSGTAVPGGTTSFPGSASGTTISLNAGSYSVTETGPAGYTSQQPRLRRRTVALAAQRLLHNHQQRPGRHPHRHQARRQRQRRHGPGVGLRR